MRRVLLAMAVAALAGGCTWLDDRKTVRSVVDEVQPLLDAQRAVLGPVEIHGDEIDLLDGRLVLAIRVPHDGDSRNLAPVHVHALATATDRKTGRLDLCIVGTRPDDAARALTQNALPPLVSAMQQQPVLGASHAWSDTVQGISGHSAYLGLSYVRGDHAADAVSKLMAAGVFANLPELPRDGRMHLLKVVISAERGDWLRSLELDGDTMIETSRPLQIASSAPAMVVGFVVLDGEVDPRSDTAARQEAHRRLAAHPKWLPAPHECPTKLMPAKLETFPWDDAAARGGRLLYAVRACEAGSGEHCYAAAQEILAEDPASPAAQSLFLAACRLGGASGCTNAAASRALDDCSFTTYEATCDRGHDPWGCTMLGRALALGEPQHRDLQRARTVLPKACALGEADPACQAATQLLRTLLAAPPASPGPGAP